MLERRVEVLRPSCTYRLPLRLASDAVSLLVLSSFFFGVLPHDLTASHVVCPTVSLWHNLATVQECACLLAFPAPRWPIFKLHAADLCNTLNAHIFLWITTLLQCAHAVAKSALFYNNVAYYEWQGVSTNHDERADIAAAVSVSECSVSFCVSCCALLCRARCCYC